MSDTYAKSGVDVDIESMAAKILYEAAKKTFENREGNIGEVIVPFDDFSGVRAIDVSKLPEGSMMCLGFDGIGTKAEIAQRMDKHDTMAFDLLAMVCDDAILRGAEPVLVGSILDVNTLGTDESRLSIVRQLAKGYVEAAKAANVAVINGELAQLGHAVGGYGKNLVYNWGSALVWFTNKDKMFTGKEIQVGDSIVMLQEKGFRANGLSLVRKIFQENFGDEWHDKEFKGEKLGLHVLVPSTIYSKAFVHMHGGFQTDGCCEIHGVAHITGGGIREKIARVLRPSGFGAKLDNLFEPCDAMKYCQKLGNVSDEEAYRAWNMGQGLAIITPEPEKVIEEAEKFGIKTMLAGKVVEEKNIIIKSQGVFKKGELLKFPIE
ncbi:AIR synthase-related protein [Bacteroidota bacterium]